MMKISIITPSLNDGRFIREAIESVEMQVGVEVEHLVIDGGSTDGTLEELERHPQLIWISESDRGMSDAINKGFERATGDWVMWLNADDRLKPGALAAFAAEAPRHPDADVIYGSFDFINESGSFIRRVKLLPWSSFIHVQHCCYVPSTAAFYRRATVIAPGNRLRSDFHYVMDGEFYARLAAAGLRFSYLPVVLADFRLHQGNTSMSHSEAGEDAGEVLKAEKQNAESRAIRRVYGVTCFRNPYLNGLIDGILWIAAKSWKVLRKLMVAKPVLPPAP